MQLTPLRPLAPRPSVDAEPWSLPSLAGRLTELGGGAAVTFAFRLVLEAQRAAEPAAWITVGRTGFYPPDAAETGVDLDALVVVRAPDGGAVARAADPLARSGAFGLVILQLPEEPAEARVAPPLLTRLLGLAQKHDVAIVFLTQTPLGSLISLRAEVRARRDGPRLGCALLATKDKRRAPGWTLEEVRHGPAGLR